MVGCFRASERPPVTGSVDGSGAAALRRCGAPAAEDPRGLLRRVGTVLIIVGVVDICAMLVVVASGDSYSSIFNIFAVIAGFLLRRGNLGAARLVRSASAFLFAAVLTLPALAAVVYPADLLKVYYRLTPALQLVGWGGFLVALLAMLWWVYRTLSTFFERTTLYGVEDRRQLRRRAKLGFVAGVGVTLALVVVPSLALGGEDAREARARARARLGPDHRYTVTALSTSSVSGAATHVRATVLAYTDASIETLQLDWRR